MYRLAWFIAGCVVSYIASGYIEGLMDEGNDSKADVDAGVKKAPGGAT
jgi:hypothetical protein